MQGIKLLRTLEAAVFALNALVQFFIFLFKSSIQVCACGIIHLDFGVFCFCY